MPVPESCPSKAKVSSVEIIITIIMVYLIIKHDLRWVFAASPTVATAPRPTVTGDFIADPHFCQNVGFSSEKIKSTALPHGPFT